MTIKVYQTRELGHAIVRVTDVILLSDYLNTLKEIEKEIDKIKTEEDDGEWLCPNSVLEQAKSIIKKKMEKCS